jgi:hypothetical protein
MAIIKSIPSKRIIGGQVLTTSEISVVSETTYRTNGESCIVVRGVSESVIILDSKTTDHVVVKSMINLMKLLSINSPVSNLDSSEVIGISSPRTV